MGTSSSINTKTFKVLMLGIDSHGKTTILYRFKLNQFISAEPTMGYNIEPINIGNVNLNIWDVGGCSKIRNLWFKHAEGCNGCIWVIDAADRARMEDCFDELDRALDHQLMQSVSLLIFLNKQDLPQSLSESDFLNSYDISKMKDRPYHVQPCIATTGEGLREGFTWLAESLSRRF